MEHITIPNQPFANIQESAIIDLHLIIILRGLMISVKISVMREFVRLAALKNYSRTAEELFIAQSALSRHMASLEEELNTQLINRSRNSFELTPAGESALESFKKVLGEYENLLEQISRNPEAESGELHLGILYYDRDFYVSKIRETFRRKYPNVKLVLHSHQPAQLESALLEHKLDAIIVYGAADSRVRGIETLPFLKIPYSLIYLKSHRFSQLKDIQISDLDGEKLLCPEAPLEINNTGDALFQMLERGGARIADRIPVQNYDDVAWLMEESGAIYISPMVNNRAYGENTEYRFLLPENYRTDVSVVWLKENKNPAINLLCSAVKMCYP